jgi:hypothetical protein
MNVVGVAFISLCEPFFDPVFCDERVGLMGMNLEKSAISLWQDAG